jgi:MSHA biogenesis protein MshM
MYLEYFALNRHPFRITPDPTLFCPGGGRGEILEALIYAITTGEGIIKVVGEVGSGKTMLCRILEERLPKSIEIVYLANPKLSPHDILYAIAFELKLPAAVETERLKVMRHLQSYLLQQHSANRSVVVFIEEAQGMPVETLEEIRLLSNLETHRHKLLQIVLFGQPELDKTLKKRDIRQLKERITHSFHLEPLTLNEVSEYIRFRLQASGCSKSRLFTTSAERLIFKASRGLIRRINILADKSMLAAYTDPVVGTRSTSTLEMVHCRHVRAAIRDSEFRMPFFRPALYIGGGMFFLIVAIVVISGWNRLNTQTVRPAFLSKNTAPLSSTSVESQTTKVNIRSPEILTKRQPVSEKPSSIREQGGKNPIGAVPPTGQVSGAVAAQIPAPESFSSPAVHPSHNDYIARKENNQEETSGPLQRSIMNSGKNLVELRRQATIQWLQEVNRNDYTIQLMAVDSSNAIDMERFFQQISPTLLLEKVYVCPVKRGEHDLWVAVFSTFQGASSARRAINDLPLEMRRFNPFVRRLSGVVRQPSLNNTQG